MERAITLNLRVHMLHDWDNVALETLRESAEAQLLLTCGREVPSPANYEVLVGGRPERKHLASSEDLHTFIVPWAGLPSSTRELLPEFPQLAVHNLHHNAGPVAEHAMALLLAAARQIVRGDRGLRTGDWTFRYEGDSAVLLEGKTALVLGYGSIGQRVAMLCRAFGMQVLATKRSLEASQTMDSVQVFPAAALLDVLPRAEALIITLPLTDQTRGLLGTDELVRLPEGALLVNVGRGEIVRQQALYDALANGQLGAAGIDVWYNYPPDKEARGETFPADLPLHELDNVVMSPHRAGSSDQTTRLRMTQLARLLDAIASGETVPNRVDLELGY